MTVLAARLLGAATALAASAAAAAPIPNFSIAVVPDTQIYAYSEANESNPDSPANALLAAFPDAFAGLTDDIMSAQTKYLRDNAGASNLKFVTHVGDITQGTIDRDEAAPEARAALPQHDLAGQWDVARNAYQVLKDAGIPFSVAIGNHDDSEDGYNDTALWREHFGSTSGFFTGLDYHLGFSDNERNSAQLIDVGHGQSLLHLSLDYLETQANQDERAAFAQQVIDANPGVPTIVTTHKNVDETGSFQSAGRDLIDRVVTPNEEIFLVLNGHYTTSPFEAAFAAGIDGSAEQVVVTTNAAGETVYHVLANYQYSVPLASGWLRFVEFDFLNGELDFTTVSPLGLDDRIGAAMAFGAMDEFPFGTTSRFSLPIDFASAGFNATTTPIPLPAPAWMLAAAVGALVGLRRR